MTDNQPEIFTLDTDQSEPMSRPVTDAFAFVLWVIGLTLLAIAPAAAIYAWQELL